MPADPAQRAAGFPPGERTLPALLLRQAERFGDRPLFRADGTCWSFAGICDVAARAAGRLAAAGIRRGDRVAILCGNRPEFLELFLGCAWSGIIAVPLNIAARGPSLRHMLENSGARLLASEPAMHEALASTGLDLPPLWDIDELPALGEAVPPAPLAPGDTLAILYTSGTTGPSKGVCCPHAQMFWWGINAGCLLSIREGDVLGTTLPLFHTNALNAFCQALLHGATLAVELRFSASRFWPTMAASGATVGYLLGAMVPILLSRPPEPAERQHRLRIALAPGVPAQFHKPFLDRTGLRLLDGYGSTETNFVIGTDIDRQRPGCMGPIAAGFAAEVVDADGAQVADNIAGELVLRAAEPLAFATGYWAMPDATAQAFRSDGFHTGDRVVREPDGNFRFVDRMKDAIRRRGENISSFEVEQVLLAHPQIGTCAVFPVRSELAEDEVMAAIVCDGDPPSPEAVIAHCAALLPYFAVPRYLEFLSDLPVTESGKIQKFRLVERGVTAATWDGDVRRG